MRRRHDVLHRQSNLASPLPIAALSINTAIDLHGRLQLFAVPAFVVKWFAHVEHIEVENCAKGIYFNLDVAWLAFISLNEQFHDFLQPQMLIAPFESCPDVV